MAFAMSLPEARVMLYFIIPIKMKYFAFLELFLVALYLISGDVIRRCVIVVSMINFAIFYFSGRKAATKTPYRSGFAKGAVYKKRPVNNGSSNVSEFKTITRHKCAICGRTEVSNPELEFRFCSKCNGNYEYCSDHLFTHKHVE